MLAETLTSWKDTWGHIRVGNLCCLLAKISGLSIFWESLSHTVLTHLGCRWEAIWVLHMSCPFHTERHHEDAYSAETHRECGQVPLSTLWYRHRTQKWPRLVTFCLFYLKLHQSALGGVLDPGNPHECKDQGFHTRALHCSQVSNVIDFSCSGVGVGVVAPLS